METPWIRHRKPSPAAKTRLLCLPYAGGAAMVYRSWQRFFPDEIEVLPVEPPGRGTRRDEASLTSVAGLAAAAIEGLQSELSDSFCLYGHSYGALVAFEMTQILRERRMTQPRLLCLSSRRAPHLGADQPYIHSLADTDFLDAMSARYQAIPDAIRQEPELMALLLPALRADMEAFERYRCEERPPLTVPLSLFGGKDDSMVSRDDLEQWSRYTTKAISVTLFSGGHFFFQPNPKTLIEAITVAIAEERSAARRQTRDA